MKFASCLFFLFISFESFCQSALPAPIRATETLNSLSGGLSNSEVTYGIPMPEPKLIGDSYLYKDWKRASLILYEEERLVQGYFIRYELLKNELEFRIQKGIKVLNGDKVRSFVWIDSLSKTPHYFVNGKDYKINGVNTIGFLNVLSDGKYPLLKKDVAVIKKAQYSVHFDVGSRDDQIIKSSYFYYLSGTELKEAPTSKKGILALFADKSSEVQKFIKINSLNFKEQNHLTAVFEYYNSLSAKQ